MESVSSGYPQVILGSSSRVWHDFFESGKGDGNLKKSHKWREWEQGLMTTLCLNATGVRSKLFIRWHLGRVLKK